MAASMRRVCARLQVAGIKVARSRGGFDASAQEVLGDALCEKTPDLPGFERFCGFELPLSAGHRSGGRCGEAGRGAGLRGSLSCPLGPAPSGRLRCFTATELRSGGAESRGQKEFVPTRMTEWAR